MKTASKEILFHGTNARNLKRILSQGLVAKPKRRAWQEDPDASFHTMSRKSYPGVYLTENLLTARGAVRDASDGIIVVVSVETRSLVPDEDDITHVFRGAFESGFPEEGFVLTEYNIADAYIDAIKDKDRRFDRVANKFLDSKFRESGLGGKAKKALRKSLFPHIVELAKAYAIRQMAFKKKEDSEWKKEHGYASTIAIHESDLEKAGLDYADIPSVSEAEKKLRDKVEVITRKMKRFAEKTGGFNYTARMIGDIGYSGKNKIVAVVGYTPLSESGRTLTVHYVKDRVALAKLFKEWKRTTGSFEVVYRREKGMRKARLKDKDIMPAPDRECDVRSPRRKKRKSRKRRDPTRREDPDRKDELDQDIYGDKDLVARVSKIASKLL